MFPELPELMLSELHSNAQLATWSQNTQSPGLIVICCHLSATHAVNYSRLDKPDLKEGVTHLWILDEPINICKSQTYRMS